MIAVALLAELAKRGHNLSHATGSKSFTTTLRQVVGRRVRRVKEVFRYTHMFSDAERNGLNVLIMDEAHRIRLETTYRFMKAEKRSGVPQADELVRAACGARIREHGGDLLFSQRGGAVRRRSDIRA